MSPKMRPNFALYGAAAAVALVALATVAEAAYAKYTPSYESDYGHVDEYKSNYYKHEAKYPSSYESDDYEHETSGGNDHYEPREPSYGSHYEEDYGYEEYTPSHYKLKYSTAPSYKHKPSYDSYSADEDYAREQSYKHQPSYRHKRSVGYGSPYGSQSYEHKPSYGYAKRPSYGYAKRPTYRHRRSVDSEPLVDKCSEREGQSLTHMKEQLAKGLMDCPVSEGGEPECGCECSPFWYFQGGEKNGDCNKLSDLGIPFCYLYSPNSCAQAHSSSLVPNGKWKHCV